MNKLEQLKIEIEEKEGKKRQEKILEYLALLNGLSTKEVENKLDKLIEKEPIKVEEKTIEFPKEFKVNNLGDIKFPEQKEVIIPEPKAFPKEIEVKKPKWFNLDGIKKEITDLKLTIIKQFSFDFNLFKKKQNAVAVRLVTKDGVEFYNAGGGSGGGGDCDVSSVITDPLAKYKFTDVDDDGTPNYYGATDKDGNWYILKEVILAGANTYRYARGTTGYATYWTNRATLSYDYFFNIF